MKTEYRTPNTTADDNGNVEMKSSRSGTNTYKSVIRSWKYIYIQDESVYEPNEMINEYWMKNVQFDSIALAGFVLENNEQQQTVSDACNSRNKWAFVAIGNKGIFLVSSWRAHHFSPFYRLWSNCRLWVRTKVIKIINTQKLHTMNLLQASFHSDHNFRCIIFFPFSFRSHGLALVDYDFLIIHTSH